MPNSGLIGSISCESSTLDGYHDTFTFQVPIGNHYAGEPSVGKRLLRHGAVEVAEALGVWYFAYHTPRLWDCGVLLPYSLEEENKDEV